MSDSAPQAPGHVGDAAPPPAGAARGPAPQPPPQSLAEAVGGPLGVVESALPPSAYVIAYTASGQDSTVAVVVAVASGVVLAVSRLARGQTLRYAAAGLAGVALAAFVVARSGRAEDFFLPGLLVNAAYASAYLVSIALRWPLIGVVAGMLTQRGNGWRGNPVEMRAFTRASWVWVALFSLRLAVQLPLYLAGAVVALGVARVAMGVPLFVVGAWLSWLLVRGTPTVSGAARERAA